MFSISKRLIPVLLLVLAACGPRTEPFETAARPNSDRYAAALPAGGTSYSNASLATLFGELTFGLEWGGERPQLMRFDPPVRVGLSGAGTQAYEDFTDRLLDQIRSESKIDISRTAAPHDLIIRFVPGQDWQPLAPNQCIVVFGQPTWEEFLASPRKYSSEAFREPQDVIKLAVLIPNTIEPYKVRECLIEEITQALGPANDLYGLSYSIFNDDDAHTWPTRLDYLMLRVLYDPAMENGLQKPEAVRRARKILDRINPDGRRATPLPARRQTAFLKWNRKLHGLHKLFQNGDNPTDKVIELADELVAEASKLAPNSGFHCQSLITRAQVARSLEAGDAQSRLDAAKTTCAAVFGKGDIRLAQIGLTEAISALDNERYAEAVSRVDVLLPMFLAHAQDGLTATAYALRWAALLLQDDPGADSARRDAVAWSAYAFGNDNDLVERWRRF